MRPCLAIDGAVSLKRRRKRLYVTVVRDGLARQESGSLRAWAMNLEKQHCVAPGEGMRLAVQVVESVPLEPATAFNLIYPSERQVDEWELEEYGRLRVVSPLWRDPRAGLAAANRYVIAGQGHSSTITVKSTDNLIGYETTVYAVETKQSRLGYAIVPLYTVRHIDGKSERRPLPAANYFGFPREAAFYRLFYKSSRNDFTALIVGARTPGQLDQRIKLLQAAGATASCDMIASGMCITIPKDVGVTPLISVTVNGAEVLVSRGATVSDAIRSSGETGAAAVVRSLKVYKSWNGRLTEVAFDPSGDAILKLVLKGGESISWR